jgi:hypothetical protein
MAGFKTNEEARQNRLASMTDTRPESDTLGASSRVTQFQGRVQLRDACLIRLDRIEADPNQPRAEFDAESLDRLAASLKQRGQLQPIRVRWDDVNSRYIVIVGERRWRAAKLAGLESLACVVVPGNASPEEILEDQLVENCLTRQGGCSRVTEERRDQSENQGRATRHLEGQRGKQGAGEGQVCPVAERDEASWPERLQGDRSDSREAHPDRCRGRPPCSC